MFSNKKLAVAVSGAVLLMAGQFALADSTTDIVDALVSKGVLTEEEGKLISKGHETKKKADGSIAFKDGFKINSGDGKSNMSINGRIQTDYRAFDSGAESTGNSADTFDIRRAYLTAKGTFRGWINYEATLNAGGAGSQTATASNKLLKYYWLEAAFSDQFKVRFGQFKTPMGLETQTSSRFNDMTERDWVASLSPSINKGVMVHGVPFAGTTYQFMVSNGGRGYETGENAIETPGPQDGKSYSGRLTANFAEIAGNKEAIAHVGVAYVRDVNVGGGTVAFKTNANGLTFFTSGTFGATDINRIGLEGVLAQGPFKLAAEYANDNFEQQAADDRDISAYYVNASWMVTGESYSSAYKNGLYDRMIPKANYTGFGSTGWGAWEVALRYSDLDASDFRFAGTNRAAAATGMTAAKAKAYTAGVKWIVDPNTRFLADYIYTDFNEETAGGTPVNSNRTKKEQGLNLRAQFDF